MASTSSSETVAPSRVSIAQIGHLPAGCEAFGSYQCPFGHFIAIDTPSLAQMPSGTQHLGRIAATNIKDNDFTEEVKFFLLL